MWTLVPVAVTAVLAVGCSSSSGGTAARDTPSTPGRAHASSTSEAGTASPSSPSGSEKSTPTPLPTKVLVVIEENHSLAQMREGMPFLAALSDRYGYATDWHALAHPSEPNYLAIVGGSMFGVTDDGPPADNAGDVGSAPSVFSQARGAGRSAATYAESMPAPCSLVDGYPYAVRHNPWTYFAAEGQACREHDLDTTSFRKDARADRLPNIGFLIPNMIHDAHDAPLEVADAWLKEQLGPVLTSKDFISGDLVVVVTADEDDRHSGNTVLTSVLSPRLHHVVVDTTLTHYSLTRFISQVLRVTPLGQGGTAPDLASAFGL